LVNGGYRIPEGRSVILILASVLRVGKEMETTHLLLPKKADNENDTTTNAERKRDR